MDDHSAAPDIIHDILEVWPRESLRQRRNQHGKLPDVKVLQVFIGNILPVRERHGIIFRRERLSAEVFKIRIPDHRDLRGFAVQTEDFQRLAQNLRIHHGFVFVRRPAELRHPDRLFRLVFFLEIKERIQEFENLLRFSAVQIGMNVHDIIIFRRTRFQALFQIRNRHTRSSAEHDLQLRIDFFDLFMRSLQEFHIVLRRNQRTGLFIDVRFIPDLPVTELLRIPRDRPADILPPLVKMPICRMRPRNVVSENREKINPVFLCRFRDKIQLGIIPDPLPRLRLPPGEPVAHPADSAVFQNTELRLGQLPLFPFAHMGADAVWRIRRIRRKAEQRQPGKQYCQFFHLFHPFLLQLPGHDFRSPLRFFRAFSLS